MDAYQLECSQAALVELKNFNPVSERVADLIAIVERRLNMCLVIFGADGMGGAAFNSDASSMHELPQLTWRATIEAVQLLITQVEQETQSRPGCLPADQEGCRLMSLLFRLRREVMEGYGFSHERLESNRGNARKGVF